MEVKMITKKTVNTIINKMVNREILGWPPECIGIFHQPVRPKVEEMKEEKTVECE